jgi:hypothetical protein
LYSTPDPPTGLTEAAPSDCDSKPAVRAVAGGSADACRTQLNNGAVVFWWNPYSHDGCTIRSQCFLSSYGVYKYHTPVLVASVTGETQTAALIPGAKLGDCFNVRARRATLESSNSHGRCVTVVRSTNRQTLSPTEIGQFQAMVHDNADSSFCTRRSWDTTWAAEGWGFKVHTSVLKAATNNTAGSRLTIGWLGQFHPGTQPFACPEGLTHVYRGYMTFDVPAEARTGNSSIVFAFTPAVATGSLDTCFHYLWAPHHWYYNLGQGASPTIGYNDSRLLDHEGDALGYLSLSDGRASFDFSSDAGVRSTGHIAVMLAAMQDGLNTDDVAHAVLHEGRYFPPSGNAVCGANNPHIEINYVRAQSTSAPVLIDDLETDRVKSQVPVLVHPTATPSVDIRTTTPPH